MAVDGAGDRQSLLLPAGYVGAALCDGGFVGVVFLLYEFGGLGHFACLAHVGHIGIRAGFLAARLASRLVARLVAVAHVGGDGAFEQERLLRYVADLVAQGFERVVAHVHAVDQHLALCGVVEARHQVDE